jgi:hypothetical protein
MYLARILSVVAVVCVLTCVSRLPAQEKPTKEKPDNKPVEVPGQAERFKKFEESMAGVKLVGHFTVDGKDDEERHEEYTINSVKKLEKGDFWTINARIKYGKIDTTVALPPLEVKWAGDTPIITLTDFTIPLLGTFGARVMIHEGKYAGTWKHGEAGGLMYGDIVKIEEEKGDK